MKKTIRLIGIIALAAVIGFTFAACDDVNGGGDGTAPTVTTTTLPNGTVGTAYSQTLAATGDTPITWSIDTGSLPGGLNLSTAGVISGTPTTADTFNFTVKATNATGSDTKALSIVIASSGGDPIDPQPPSASISGSVTVTATKANASGNGAEDADATVTVNLTNATVNAALSADASTWFTPSVAGLNYTASAAAGATAITITIEGIPEAVSTATATISIPAGTVKDTEGTATTAPLTVSGNITYNIGEADPNALPTPAAAIDGSVTVTSTKANFSNEGGEAANATVTLNLTNATVNTALSAANASAWFTPTVAGLTYTANAAAGASAITVTIAGTPTAVSTANATISIPAGTVKNTEGTATTTHLTVSGHITYDIEAYPDPEITAFTFTPTNGLKIGESNTAASAVVGSLNGVIGGTSPFTYTLVSGSGSTDNALFVIGVSGMGGGYELKVGSSALTAAKEYSVRVQVTDAAGITYAKAVTFTVAQPDLTGTVSISGTAEVGETLTANTTSLDGSGAITYEWKRGGTTTIGTNSQTYVLQEADKGSTITVTVTRAGYIGSKTSDPTAVVTGQIPVPTGLSANTGYNPSILVELSWNSVNEATSYNVYRSTDGSNFSSIGTPTTTSYQDQTAGQGVNYYKVAAVTAEGESTMSASVQATAFAVSSLTFETWSTNTITPNSSINRWYAMDVVSDQTYYVHVKKEPSATSVDFLPTAYSNTMTQIVEGNYTGLNFTASYTGKVYIKVAPNNYNSGSAFIFQIAYNQMSAPPAGSESGYLPVSNILKIGSTFYTSLSAAVNAVPNDTPTDIIVVGNFNLSSTVTIGARKNVTLKAETDGLKIGRAASFSGEFLKVDDGKLTLGNGWSAGSHTPTLILNGGGSGTLVTVSFNVLEICKGVELRNAGVAVYVEGGMGDNVVNMNGGVIAGNGTGAQLMATSTGNPFTMTGGIIYGNAASGAGANANTNSVRLANSRNRFTPPDGININGPTDLTQTYGTAP